MWRGKSSRSGESLVNTGHRHGGELLLVLGLADLLGGQELVLCLGLHLEDAWLGLEEAGGCLVAPDHIDDPGAGWGVVCSVQEDCLPESYCGG